MVLSSRYLRVNNSAAARQTIVNFDRKLALLLNARQRDETIDFYLVNVVLMDFRAQPLLQAPSVETKNHCWWFSCFSPLLILCCKVTENLLSATVDLMSFAFL